MNVLENLDRISWSKIQGNRYSKSLDSGMLLKGGSPHFLRTRVVGGSRTGAETKLVIYDKDYVIKWLIVKLIKPLSNHGLDTVVNLLKEAWTESGLSTDNLLDSKLATSPKHEEQV